MPECEYCGDRFDSQDDLHAHWRNAHADELGPIDRRKVGLQDEGGSGPNWGLVVLVFLVAGGLAVAIGAVWLGGSDTGGDTSGIQATITPTDLWSVHYHGTIEVLINGQAIDFSRERYQLQADAFHFENNNGQRWHGHARQVTLEYAMATLGIEVTRTTVTIDGKTYRNATAGTTVRVTVNREPVTPSQYTLSEGNHIRIVVRTS